MSDFALTRTSGDGFLDDRRRSEVASGGNHGDGPWGIGGAKAPCCTAGASAASGGSATYASAADDRGASATGADAVPPKTRAALLARLRSQAPTKALSTGGAAASTLIAVGMRGHGRDGSSEFERPYAACSDPELAQGRDSSGLAEPLHAARGEGMQEGGGGVRPLPADTAVEGVSGGTLHGGGAVGIGASAANAALGGACACDFTAPEVSQTRAVPSSVTAARGPSRSDGYVLASGAVPSRRRIVGKQPGAVARLRSATTSASPRARTTPSVGSASQRPTGRPPDLPV